MKIKSIGMLVLLGIIALGVTFIVNSQEHDNSLIVSAESFPRNISTGTPYPTGIPGISLLAMQKFAHSQILTVSANGIEMSATNFRMEDNKLKVDICFQKPSNDNWLILDAAIKIGDTEFTIDGGSGIEETSTLDNGKRHIFTFANRAKGTLGQEQTVEQNGMPDYRCDTLDFRIELNLKPSRFNLVIKTLMLDRNQGEECSTYRDAVQGILDAKELGIRLDCVAQEYGSFQSIAEKPVSMSQEEAEQYVRDAFREAFTFTGPWIFTGEIEQ